MDFRHRFNRVSARDPMRTMCMCLKDGEQKCGTFFCEITFKIRYKKSILSTLVNVNTLVDLRFGSLLCQLGDKRALRGNPAVTLPH